MPTTDLDNVARRLVIKDIQSGHDLIDVFKQLSQIDDDFNGNNGPDYLWDVARKGGFRCNMDYIIDRVMNQMKVNTSNHGITAITDRFVKEWRRADKDYNGYYSGMVIEVEKLNGIPVDSNMTGVYAFAIIAV